MIVMLARNGHPGMAAARMFAAIVTLTLALAAGTAWALQAPPADPETQEQVLTQGPVHEAFALPVVNDPGPGLVASRQPPEPIEEMPPEEKPAGANVQWISGYWSWDGSRNDFLWVSGVWREPPPGRQWVPGYWNQADRGFQWVPGAWVPVSQGTVDQEARPAAASQAAYLPQPPASLEVGPSSPTPSSQVFWSPGSWSWQAGRYVWRPGFWAAVQPEWVWMPAHYVWTPGGYLFVEGYWDLPLANRGVLFAPVYYPQPVYLQPSYVYTPSITISTPGLVANLFVQPRYSHYYFGDYYDRSFLSVGIVPWFSFTYASGPSRPAYHDPLFSYYTAVNVGRDPGWATRVHEEYVVRRENAAMRPARTYIEQTRIIERNVNITRNVTINNNNRTGETILGRPIRQLAARPGAGGAASFEKLSAESRAQWKERSLELRDYRAERIRLERQAPAARETSRPMALNASPVSAPVRPRVAAGGSPGPRAQESADRRVAARERPPVTPAHRQAGPQSGPRDGGPAGPASRPSRNLAVTPRPAPHTDSAAATVADSAPRQQSSARGASPRLNAPAQLTHRQPPPPPRPAPRDERKPAGRRYP